MIVSPAIVTAAKRNGDKQLAASVVPGERFTQVDAVVDLLADSTSPAAQPGARDLLQRMADTDWRVIRGAHISRDDGTPHVTIEVGRTRYHLRLDARNCVFDITWVTTSLQRPGGRAPWMAPGT